MNKTDNELLAELTTIFREVLDVDDLELSAQTTANDVDDWDSLAHIQLVLAIGKHFGTKFTTEEVITWTNVGSIMETIKKHLA